MTRLIHLHIPLMATNSLHSLTVKGRLTKIEGVEIEDYGFGIKQPNNFSLPENYPNCCPFHKSLVADINSWFTIFPNCCPSHRALKEQYWFNKSKYNHLPTKIENLVLYTEFIFSKSINEGNWFIDITHYVDYCVDSLGYSQIGTDKYLNAISHSLTHNKEVGYSESKRNKLLEYIKQCINPREKKDTDLNNLISIFQKWIKIFPDLVYFKDLKERFKDKIPLNLILKESKQNIYSGKKASRSLTQNELIECLIKLTKELLKQVNTESLLKNGTIEERAKYEIDLIFEEKQIKQNKLLDDFSGKEGEYMKIIKKWLKNEIDCFEKLRGISNIQITTQNITVQGDNNNILQGDANTIVYNKKD